MCSIEFNCRVFIRPKGRIMTQAVCPISPLANSCEHNSYSFQWMILKPSRIYHPWYLVVGKGCFFSLSFPNRVKPLFQIFAYAYKANSCEHNSSYSFQWMIFKPCWIVTYGRLLCKG